MRYIDADKIIYTWLTDANGKEHDGVTLQSVIDAQPTADVRENIRGKWIKAKDDVSFHYECSVCKAKPLYEEFCHQPELSDFCPNCGADMRGEQCE